MKGTAMKTSKQYLRFCGIDMAKHKHVACIIDQNAQYLLRPRTIRNDADGFAQILNCLKQTGRAKSILTGMEATGNYWYGLHDFLARHGYDVIVLNPIQTALQAKQAIRKCKTDKYDAFHIASLLRTNQYKAAVVPDELAMTCRQITRLRYRIVKQAAMIKQLVNSRLHPAWPEYEGLFSNKFGTTSVKLLQTASTPNEIMEIDPDELSELIHRASKGRFGPAQTQKVLLSAKNSVGMQRGLYGISTGIKFLLEQIDALEPVRKKMDEEVIKLTAKVPQYLFTLPGATDLTIVSLYGEVSPIEAFENPSKLVAFAGLDPKVFQSGQYDAPRRHISKRGSPYLRRSLWQMAYRAICTEGDLRDFWRRKHCQNKHHLVAVTAVANKLCRIVWRIMTDRRDYIRKGYNPKS
jgi:transposase